MASIPRTRSTALDIKLFGVSLVELVSVATKFWRLSKSVRDRLKLKAAYGYKGSLQFEIAHLCRITAPAAAIAAPADVALFSRSQWQRIAR